MHYIGFAKKYRPASFAQLHGQEVLIKVLSHEIQNNRLAQGYLLTGIRGVGKTTSARIIAKSVNCTNLTSSLGHVAPCESCKNCEAFTNNNHPDILEIDAASKTGVDDIRSIIESSEYRPLLGKYKIFIIDEIHMLSKNAFNALLKVLEEPPEHIIFIFATTEVQKLPITIISRCQRFDLKRLTFQEIFILIQKISQAENLEIEETAINIIAAHSEGSARDAISLLDQAVSMEAGNKITTEMINRLLGSIDLGITIKFFNHIADHDSDNAIQLLNNIYLDGANLELLFISVSNLIAYLSKAKLLTNYSENLYQNYKNEITNILLKTNIATLSILWQIFANGLKEIKEAHNQIISSEMLIIKAIYATQISFLDTTSVNKFVSTENNDENKSVISASPDIISFLRYLHDMKEMEIYYALMNEVEIKNLTDNLLELAITAPIKFKDILIEHLLKWSKREYEITIIKQSKVLSIKEKLIDEIKQSSLWQKINQSFPLANISDILFAE